MASRRGSTERLLATALMLTIATIGYGILIDTPASANDGVCGTADLCLYENTSRLGGRWDDSGFESDYSSGDNWWGTNRSINDAASSVESKNTVRLAQVWQHSWYRGSYIAIGPGIYINNLADYGFNDRASSNSYF